ncbi:MAG: hypothetical protein COV67_10435 [Nitrospinae bacterium CG11_big_fil_rev_8_21_14_0_20_56_8]|nr:MAG: hypothetical protein COV67_10435 [Nitrospinae bacterium CG11_big_fil_rev_8_21_14_0_20_56_8]
MKQGTENFKVRILVPFGLALLLILGVSFNFIFWQQQNHVDQVMHQNLQRLQNALDQVLREEAQTLDSYLSLLLTHPELLRALEEKNRDHLLELTQPLFANLRENYGVTHLYFYRPDRTAFLRVHLPEIHGDAINRNTLLNAAKTLRENWNIEVGRFGTLTLRNVRPCIKDGQLIGFVEIGKELLNFTTQISHLLNIEMILLLDKKLIQRSEWETRQKAKQRTWKWDLLRDEVVIDSTLNSLPGGLAPAMGSVSGGDVPAPLFSLKDPRTGRNWQGGEIPLRDNQGIPLGHILILHDTRPDAKTLSFQVMVLIAIAVLGGGCLLTLAWFYVQFIEKSLTQARRDLSLEIWKREATGKSLLESESRLQDIINNTNAVIFSKDPKGRHLHINRECERILGLKCEAIRGKTVFDLFPREIAEILECNDQKVLAEGKPVQYEETLPLPDGKHTFISIKFPLKDAAGNTYGLCGISTDISDRKRAEEELIKAHSNLEWEVAQRTSELRKTNKQLQIEISEREKIEQSLIDSQLRTRAVVEGVLDGIITFNDKGDIETLNSSAELLFGYTLTELMRKNFSLLLAPENRENLDRVFGEIRKRGRIHPKSSSSEMVGLRKDGSTFPMEVAFNPVTLGKGMIVVGVFKNITLKKQAEENIKNSHEQLRRLYSHIQTIREEERNRIAREIHDELGQVLTTLKLELSWLLKKLPEAETQAREKAQSILNDIDSTIQMVKRLITKLRPEILDLLGIGEAIEWQTEEFQQRTGVETECIINAPGLSLDPERSIALFRIFQEALTNVTRHAEASRVVVNLRRNDDKLELEVIDDGKGLDESSLSNLTSYGLTGMRERVLTLGGKISIEGPTGQGTRIWVRIPCQ